MASKTTAASTIDATDTADVMVEDSRVTKLLAMRAKSAKGKTAPVKAETVKPKTTRKPKTVKPSPDATASDVISPPPGGFPVPPAVANDVPGLICGPVPQGWGEIEPSDESLASFGLNPNGTDPAPEPFALGSAIDTPPTRFNRVAPFLRFYQEREWAPDRARRVHSILDSRKGSVLESHDPDYLARVGAPDLFNRLRDELRDYFRIEGRSSFPTPQPAPVVTCVETGPDATEPETDPDDSSDVVTEPVILIRPRALQVDWRKNPRVGGVVAESVEMLVSDIEQNGQINPVLVAREGNGYRLVSGYHRLSACLKIADRNPDFRVRATVVDLDAKAEYLLTIRDNSHRRELNPMDYANAIKNLSDNFGYGKEDLKAFFGRSHGWIWQHRKLLKLTPAQQAKVVSGEWSLSVACLKADAMAKLGAAMGETDPDAPEADQTAEQVKAEARAAGVTRKTGRTAANLRGLLKGREDVISRAIVAYLDGTADESAVFSALDEGEAPVIQADPFRVD